MREHRAAFALGGTHCSRCRRMFFRRTPKQRLCLACKTHQRLQYRRKYRLEAGAADLTDIPDDEFLPRFAQRPHTLHVAEPWERPDGEPLRTSPGSVYRRALALERRVEILTQLLADRETQCCGYCAMGEA